MLSGGRYTGNNLSCQEFAILPVGACEYDLIECLSEWLEFFVFFMRNAGAESFADAVKMATEIYRVLEKKIVDAKQIRGPLPISDDGALASDLENDEAALTFLDASIRDAGYEGRMKIALDMAASNFYKEGILYCILGLSSSFPTTISLV